MLSHGSFQFFLSPYCHPGIKGAGNVDNKGAFFSPYSEEQSVAWNKCDGIF